LPASRLFTLSLHDALPILIDMAARGWRSGSTHSHMNYGGNLRNTLAHMARMGRAEDLDVVNVLVANKDSRILDWEHFATGGGAQDRKSTRLNSSHGSISYA